MSNLIHKKVLVVGGSSGIGLATAHAAVVLGAIVTIASHDEAGLQAALGELGPSTSSETVNLTDNGSVDSWTKKLGTL